MLNTSKLIFRQLFDKTSSTYTYLLGDVFSKEALLIDPVLEQADRDIKLLDQLNLKLKYVLNTHVHADHVTGSGKIKQHYKHKVESVLSKNSGAFADVLVDEKDKIFCGSIKLDILNTPGHTNGCITYVNKENSLAFTGDALLIRGCGRTDFQEGSPEKLYDSICKKIFSLPKHFFLYPAHDYNGLSVTTVEEEKLFNPRLTKSKVEFVNIMNNLNLENPKMIDVAVKKNIKCGI